MQNKFSLAHLTVLGCSPEEMTYIAAKTGYDYVSFRSIGLGTVNEPQYPLAKNRQMLQATKKALKETGLELLDIEMIQIHENIDLNKLSLDLEVAAELGGKHVLTTIKTDDKQFAIETFAEICEMASQYGLTIDLEYITWYNIGTLQDAKEVVDAANCDNGGILIDLLHFDRSRTNKEQIKELPTNWLNYVHLCDASNIISRNTKDLILTAREERLYIGDGKIDVKGILNKIPQIPYSLEIPNTKKVHELGYEEHARKCLKSAKAYLNDPII